MFVLGVGRVLSVLFQLALRDHISLHLPLHPWNHWQCILSIRSLNSSPCYDESVLPFITAFAPEIQWQLHLAAFWCSQATTLTTVTKPVKGTCASCLQVLLSNFDLCKMPSFVFVFFVCFWVGKCDLHSFVVILKATLDASFWHLITTGCFGGTGDGYMTARNVTGWPTFNIND